MEALDAIANPETSHSLKQVKIQELLAGKFRLLWAYPRVLS